MIVKFSQISFNTEDGTLIIDGYNVLHYFQAMSGKKYICSGSEKYVDPVTGRNMDRLRMNIYNDAKFLYNEINQVRRNSNLENVKIREKFDEKVKELEQKVEQEVAQKINAQKSILEKEFAADKKNLEQEFEIKENKYKKDIELMKKTILSFQKIKDSIPHSPEILVQEDIDDTLNGVTTHNVILSSLPVKKERKKKSDKVSVD